MKKINQFLETAAYWKVFLISFVLIGSMVFLLFNSFIIPNQKLVISMSLFLGALFAGVFVLMMHGIRASQKFWNLADDLETRLLRVNDIETLRDLAVELDELKKMASGTPHYYKINVLYTVFLVKRQYVKGEINFPN